jgi:hypothetical protein
MRPHPNPSQTRLNASPILRQAQDNGEQSRTILGEGNLTRKRVPSPLRGRSG